MAMGGDARVPLPWNGCETTVRDAEQTGLTIVQVTLQTRAERTHCASTTWAVRTLTNRGVAGHSYCIGFSKCSNDLNTFQLRVLHLT